MKLSILKNDTRRNVEKIKDYYNDLKNQKDNTLNKKSNFELKSNGGYNTLLSKIGMSNTNAGTKEVNNYQQNFLKNQVKNTLKENTMSIQIPIKQIILEFTADHIRDNAGKYAAGTMLGLGAAAGYLAGDPSHGENLLNHGDTHINQPEHSNAGAGSTTIKLQNSGTHNVNYATGEGASLGDHLKNWGNDRANVNYHNNVMNAVNEDPSFLTGGEKAAVVGAGALGVLGGGAALAHRGGYRLNGSVNLNRMAGPRSRFGKY